MKIGKISIKLKTSIPFAPKARKIIEQTEKWSLEAKKFNKDNLQNLKKNL